ncbi:hypothetical protein ABMY47_13795 [Pseudoalteromonas sp. BZP1]|uniref:hypothetical protein n=1 Tax=unclassified Pseudoalteromonas TaxID=194690 RepID=UPI0032C425F8
MAESITENFKSVEGSCLYMSSLLFSMINEHLPVEAFLVTGSLSVGGYKVFTHSPIKPQLTQKSGVIGQWNGHAWVEVEDIIFDLSIFRTVFAPSTSDHIQRTFEDRFNRDTAYLVGQKSKLIEMGIEYRPLEQLFEDDATIFIQSSEKMKLIRI